MLFQLKVNLHLPSPRILQPDRPREEVESRFVGENARYLFMAFLNRRQYEQRCVHNVLASPKEQVFAPLVPQGDKGGLLLVSTYFSPPCPSLSPVSINHECHAANMAFGMQKGQGFGFQRSKWLNSSGGSTLPRSTYLIHAVFQRRNTFQKYIVTCICASVL